MMSAEAVKTGRAVATNIAGSGVYFMVVRASMVALVFCVFIGKHCFGELKLIITYYSQWL